MMPAIAWCLLTPLKPASAIAITSLPHLYGESKTASVGSVSRIPATDIEDIVVKSLSEHLTQQEPVSSSSICEKDRSVIAAQIARIDVHKDRLTVRLKSPDT